MVVAPKRGSRLRGLFYIDSEETVQRILITALQNRPLFRVVNRRMHIFSTNETEQGSITFQLKDTVPAKVDIG